MIPRGLRGGASAATILSMRQAYPEYRLRFTVPPDQAGRTLRDFLQARLPYFPADGWTSRIERRRLLVDNAPTRPEHVLATGSLIEYLDPDIPEPDVDTRFTIVHRDDQLLVVDKPAGLPCHPGGRYLHNSLTMLLRKDPALEQAILVNRLDRETSGLVILALDRRAGAALQRQFTRRTVEKRYEVFVEGLFPETCRAEGYIAPDTKSVVRKRRRFVCADAAASGPWPPADADAAVTLFSRMATDHTISRLAARPETGRQHQIRATLCGLGYPVVGDKLYGVDAAIFLRFCNNTLTATDRQALRIGRQALHAGYLRFTHPRLGRSIEFNAPLPPDLQPLVRRLERQEP